MTIPELNKQILSVVRQSTETDMEITASTHLIRQMGLSSVEIMLLITELEDTFGVEIPVSKLRQIQTVGDLCSTVVDTLLQA